MSIICLNRKQSFNLTLSGNDEWRLLKQERQQRKEVEEAAEKEKETKMSIQVTATAHQGDKAGAKYPVA